MAEQASKSYDSPSSSRRGRWTALALLAAAQLAFAATCSTNGIHSGEWSAPWLPYPDFLIETTSAAIIVHPIVFYPLWVSLGCGRLVSRYAKTLALCAAFAGAATARGYFRRPTEPLALQSFFIVACFSLMSLGFWSLRPFGNWRIGVPGDPQELVRSPAAPRVRWPRIQFRLRHLFEFMALVGCLLAAFRFYFPEGLPAGSFADWPRLAVRFFRHMPAVVLILLPATFIPWAVLAFHTPSHRGSRLLIAAAAFGWVALALWIVWRPPYGGVFGPFRAIEVLSIQLGANAAGLISAVYLRACGYRIFRVEREKTAKPRTEQADAG